MSKGQANVEVAVTEGSSVMKTKTLKAVCLRKIAHGGMAILCSALLVPGEAFGGSKTQDQPAASGQEEAAELPPDQLDALVAPIALYPDPMLAQVLAASTYPLELIQLQQWLLKNKDLKCQRRCKNPHSAG